MPVRRSGGAAALAVAALCLLAPGLACSRPVAKPTPQALPYSRTMRHYTDPVPGVGLDVPRDFRFVRVDASRAEWVSPSAEGTVAVRVRIRRHRLDCAVVRSAEGAPPAREIPGSRVIERFRVDQGGSGTLFDLTRKHAPGGAAERHWLARVLAPCRIIDMELSGPEDGFEENRQTLEAIVHSLRLTDEPAVESRPESLRQEPAEAELSDEEPGEELGDDSIDDIDSMPPTEREERP